MVHTCTTVRRGFTLVEVAIALVVVTVGLVAMQGVSAALVRALADAHRLGASAAVAARQRDRAFAAACARRATTDSVAGAVIATSLAPEAPGRVTGTQTEVVPGRRGSRRFAYLVDGACR